MGGDGVVFQMRGFIFKWGGCLIEGASVLGGGGSPHALPPITGNPAITHHQESIPNYIFFQNFDFFLLLWVYIGQKIAQNDSKCKNIASPVFTS